MKTIYSIKKWLLISLMFIGISLTTYAIGLQPSIRSVTVQNITSTTAEIIIVCRGAQQVRLDAYDSNSTQITSYLLDTEATESSDLVVCTFNISELTPNEEYRIEITAIGIPDPEDNMFQFAYQIGAFRTLIE